jgi:23S rRNA (pseudouridine1915-N3)-methyltransferase
VKIVVRAVGKMRDRALAGACDEYIGRARRYLPVEVAEVDGDEALRARWPAGAEVVALDPGGAAWTTRAFRDFLEQRMVRGARAVVFLLGGADGLSPASVAAAHHRVSLSPLTLPHRLARVVLAEQIYRCLSAIRGEPYDK